MPTKDFNLLKSFVQSEFFFHQKILKKNKVPKFFRKCYILRKESLIVADPLFSVKAIKQLIRIVQHISTLQDPSLQIVVNNIHVESLISTFLSTDAVIQSRLKLVLDSAFKSDIKSDRLILLLNCFLNSSSSFFHKSYKNCNILYKINPVNENNFFDTYKLSNDLDSLKKILFILIILKQTLNNHVYEKSDKV